MRCCCSLIGTLKIQSKTFTSLLQRSNFRSSHQTLIPSSKLDLVLKEIEDSQSLQLLDPQQQDSPDSINPRCIPPQSSPQKLEIVHPWPEWVELIGRLFKNGYLSGFSESALIFQRGRVSSKDSNQIRTGCLNFARDRFNLIRYLSRKDIHVVVGSGCPSLDRKVVNSGKRLRAHVGIDEGNVCSKCNLRGSCERAYVRSCEEEGGRTVDVMRILLTYGLDPFTGSVGYEPCLNRTVKESVRKLLSQMNEFSDKEFNSSFLKRTSRGLSSKGDNLNQPMLPKAQSGVPMKQGDWICPKCNFLNFARNINCLRCNEESQEKLQKLREDREHLPLKRGDWICNKCNFLNFAKNTRCLQCKEKPSNRELNPGEWECVSCNYINFRRNMACLKCDWKRPKELNCTDGFARYPHEYNSHHQNTMTTSLRNKEERNNQTFPGSKVQSREEGSDVCSETDDVNLHGKSSKFEDFPILGGKGVTSQDPNERQRWKDEMLKVSKGISRMKERNDDGDADMGNFPKSFECGNSCGDEDDIDMVGWFGSDSEIKDRELQKYANAS